MEKFLGEIKTKPELFLKLVRKISKPEYTMHMMEDRNGRKAMFYNYKGVEFKEGDCVKLKATIAEHRVNKYDNNAPLKVSNHLNVPYFATDIITAGGNYMTDGLGIGASTDLIYEENSMSNNQLHQDMLDYYGIHEQIVVSFVEALICTDDSCITSISFCQNYL